MSKTWWCIMQIPGIYSDIHIYIYENFNAFYIHTHLKVHTFLGFLHTSTVQPTKVNSCCLPKQILRSVSLEAWLAAIEAGSREMCDVGSGLWNWGVPMLGGRPPSPVNMVSMKVFLESTTWHVMIMEKVTVSGMGGDSNFEIMLDFLDEMALFFQF